MLCCVMLSLSRSLSFSVNDAELLFASSLTEMIVVPRKCTFIRKTKFDVLFNVTKLWYNYNEIGDSLRNMLGNEFLIKTYILRFVLQNIVILKYVYDLRGMSVKYNEK